MLGLGAIGQFAIGEIGTEASIAWLRPLGDIGRRRPSVAARSQFLAYQADPLTVTPFGWYAPLSEPNKARLTIRERQSVAYQANPLTVTPFAWFAWLSQPTPPRRIVPQQSYAGPAQLRPTPTSFAVLNALETPDVFLGGGTVWSAIQSGEIGVNFVTAPAGEVGLSGANTASPIGSASVSISII